MTRSRTLVAALSVSAIVLVEVSCSPADDSSNAAPAAENVGRRSVLAGRVDKSSEAAAASAAAASLWKAIDGYDVKSFVAACGEWKDGKVVDVDAKGLESMLADFHQKYGLRPRRMLKPNGAEDPAGEIEVPVLIGDREALLLCGMRKDAKGVWRLTRVSDGDPSAVPEDATTAAPPK